MKIHSTDFGFRGILSKFISRTLDFDDFHQNSFHEPLELRGARRPEKAREIQSLQNELS